MLEFHARELARELERDRDRKSERSRGLVKIHDRNCNEYSRAHTHTHDDVRCHMCVRWNKCYRIRASVFIRVSFIPQQSSCLYVLQSTPVVAQKQQQQQIRVKTLDIAGIALI